METKREVAILIPWRMRGGAVQVFLQKRGMESKVLPGYFSFFGGKFEPGENAEQAMRREIQEELAIEPKGYSFLGTYPSSVDARIVLHAYVMPVTQTFEQEITVQEGEYGTFFTLAEVADEPMLLESDKRIIDDACKAIKKC